ncbi:hypothetical protein ACJX0J_030374 [Zea mays]
MNMNKINIYLVARVAAAGDKGIMADGLPTNLGGIYTHVRPCAHLEMIHIDAALLGYFALETYFMAAHLVIMFFIFLNLLIIFYNLLLISISICIKYSIIKIHKISIGSRNAARSGCGAATVAVARVAAAAGDKGMEAIGACEH